MSTKILFQFGVLLIFLSLFVSCGTSSDPAAEAETEIVTTASLDTMPLDTAKEYTGGWQNAITNDSTIFGGKDIFAFTIPRSDFENLLEATKNTSYDFRAYLGFKPNPNIQNGEQYFELMLVAVNGNGKDVINSNNFIYDFTTPCPDQCDDNSPLCGGCK